MEHAKRRRNEHLFQFFLAWKGSEKFWLLIDKRQFLGGVTAGILVPFLSVSRWIEAKVSMIESSSKFWGAKMVNVK